MNINNLKMYSEKLSILYAEDEIEVRNELGEILVKLFGSVTEAVDGKDAFFKYTQEIEKNGKPFDLVLSDIKMPFIDGLELVEKIKEIEPNQPTIILSAYNDSERLMNLLNLNISRFVLKPINISLLMNVLYETCRNISNEKIAEKYHEEIVEDNDKLTVELEKKVKELEVFNTQLETRVQEEIEKNKEQELRLFEQTKMTAITDLLKNISHHWRQPLNIIALCAQNLEMDLEAEKPELLTTLDKITINTNFLSDTINTFTSLFKGNGELREIILQKEIEKIFYLIYPTLEDDNIDIVTHFVDSEEIRLNTFLESITQVIVNIIKNSQENFITKKIENRWIEVLVKKRDNKAVISIEDSGGGIPEEISQKIYEPYFTTKHKDRGVGLGLSNSHKIVTDSLRGKIYHQNTENGAKFSIELPLD
ncbi:MAG: response regulator [Campylobacterales bacterium]|nr:response regulator [Campylobacterales bacterium]